jgi:hypothetical protein
MPFTESLVRSEARRPPPSRCLQNESMATAESRRGTGVTAESKSVNPAVRRPLIRLRLFGHNILIRKPELAAVGDAARCEHAAPLAIRGW